jgi:hypothetical protein
MRHIETGSISPNKLYLHYKLPVVTSGRHFFMQHAPDVPSFELSSVQRNPLQAVIGQDKVAQDFFGIADVL